jgi:hypothetical protein
LDGLVYCGECGGKVVKKIKMEPDGKVRLYYACYWHAAGPKAAKLEGKKYCDMKTIDADKADAALFDQIVHLITSPKKFAKDWVCNLGIEGLRERVERLTIQEKELREQIERGFAYIMGTKDSEVRARHEAAIRKVEQDAANVQGELSNALNDLDLAGNKIARLEEFSKVASTLKQRDRFKGFLLNLPFADKRKIVESLVEPESGGKMIIRYITPADFVDDLEAVAPEKRYAPMKDQEPYVDWNFRININKVSAIIRGLNRDPLFENTRVRLSRRSLRQ